MTATARKTTEATATSVAGTGTVVIMAKRPARKFDLKRYYAYVERLPTVAASRSGRTA